MDLKKITESTNIRVKKNSIAKTIPKTAVIFTNNLLPLDINDPAIKERLIILDTTRRV